MAKGKIFLTKRSHKSASGNCASDSYMVTLSGGLQAVVIGIWNLSIEECQWRGYGIAAAQW